MMCTVILILFLPTIRNPNMGGVEKSFTNWNDQEEDPNVLLLDAGDIFQDSLL
jgi:2',3'-cyclic-nucleotide 2'-phosphodiesterase (5'-nucleotidase family)